MSQTQTKRMFQDGSPSPQEITKATLNSLNALIDVALFGRSAAGKSITSFEFKLVLKLIKIAESGKRN